MSRKKLIADKSICERIKQLRSQMDLSGVEFGNSIGISQGYLSDIENSKASPNKTLLLAISYIYNVNLNWLESGEGDRYIKEGDKKSGGRLDEDQNIDGLLKSARSVLKSGNPLAFDALERNIRYFSHAVKTEKRLAEFEAKIAEVDELKEKTATLEDRLKNTIRFRQGDQAAAWEYFFKARNPLPQPDLVRKNDPPEKKQVFLEMRMALPLELALRP